MFYDLNILWTANSAELQRTLAFSADLGYNVVAINHIITGKLPNDLTSPIPDPLPFSTPPGLKILRRCTLVIADPSQNHRLAGLSAEYDIVALRPTTDKALQLAMQSPETDLISLDLTQRFPFFFRPKLFSPALQRGLRLELSYGAGAAAGSAVTGAGARRNLISNATSLIRATRGRGLVLSSEARRALECRAPFDVMNLAAVWGLAPERGREAVVTQPRAAVAGANSRRQSYRGVVEIVVPASIPTSQKASNPIMVPASSQAPIEDAMSSAQTPKADTGAEADIDADADANANAGAGADIDVDMDKDDLDKKPQAAKRHRPQRAKRGHQSAAAKGRS